MIRFTLNNKSTEIEVEPDTPLLWVLRDILNMTGTKFGCGMAQCGACTVHLDGQPIRSCVTPISAVQNKSVMSIEGLAPDGSHPIQQAWIEYNVPQCGYCQSGQIMSAVALLKHNPNPDDEAIDSHMQGNICRCGTYPRIKAAIKSAAQALASSSHNVNYDLAVNVGEEA